MIYWHQMNYIVRFGKCAFTKQKIIQQLLIDFVSTHSVGVKQQKKAANGLFGL